MSAAARRRIAAAQRARWAKVNAAKSEVGIGRRRMSPNNIGRFIDQHPSRSWPSFPLFRCAGASGRRFACTAERRTLRILYKVCIAFSLTVSSASSSGPLRVFFVDVEGGQATLLVAPTGKSLLIDTGWPGFAGRDADRIAAAANKAGISKIDYVLVTHYHDDHVGGVPQLVKRIKIDTFVDHGPNREDSEATRANYAAYEQATRGAKRLVVKPGDRIPIEGVDIEVVSADGEVITRPLRGAGQANTLCASEPPAPADASENARSVGVVVTYGKLRVLDLGDLTKRNELQLVCPKNLLGTVDLFVVSHHGFTQSNTRALVHAVRPRIALMDNGARKGGSPDAWQTVHDSPGAADLWQLHYALGGGKEHNVAPEFIANLDENCEGKSIDVTAEADGTITVTNARTGFTKSYKK
jgi:competence protein ComEC